MFKKPLAILLCLCILLSLVTVTAFADNAVAQIAGSSTTYPSLQAAVNEAKNGDTVILLKDIVLTKEQIEADTRLVRLHGGDGGYAPNLKEGTSITFDLGGHTISFAKGVEKTTCNDYRIFNIWYTNCTVKNGTIDLRTNTPAYEKDGEDWYACTAFRAGKGATLNLDVNINAEGYVAAAYGNATVNFNGGNYTFGAGDTQIVYSKDGTQVNFNGGTYTLTDDEYENYPYVGIDFYKTILNTSAGTPFYFSGGTFVNFDPLCQCKLAHYTTSGLTEGKAMTKNGGTFTVIDATDVAATITRTVKCYKDWLADGTKDRTYSFTSVKSALADVGDDEFITLLKDTDEMSSVLNLLNYKRFIKAGSVDISLPSGYEWTAIEDNSGNYNITVAKGYESRHAVTFNANGGSFSDGETTKTVDTDKDGKLSELPAPTRTGLTFDGWYTAAEGGVKVTTDTVFTENTTVYAHWRIDSETLLAIGAVSPDNSVIMMPAQDTAAFDTALDTYKLQLMAGDTGFSDVAKTDWFYGDVTSLTSKGVVSGYPDGTFKPYGEVTWGEALKLVLKANGFGDIAATSDHWASGYMDKAIELGYISGAVDLNAAITRGEMADLCAAAMKLGDATIASPFADDAPASAVALYEAGIIKGSADNGQLLYRADSTITRAEISAIIWRMVKAR